jgi:WD40 repeat protein
MGIEIEALTDVSGHNDAKADKILTSVDYNLMTKELQDYSSNVKGILEDHLLLYDAGNSGTALTINWSNGKNQKFTLTDNCVISFSNPAEGVEYSLFWVQNSATEYNLNFPGDIEFGDYIYKSWQGTRSYGTLKLRYSNGILSAIDSFGVKLSDPATLPAGTGYSVSFSPDGKYIAVAHGSSPFINVYPWDGTFGAKIADPATLPGVDGNSVSFSPDGKYIAVVHETSPYINVYPWDGTFGAKIADPATLPAGAGRGVSFSPDGKYIAVAHDTSPFISVYPWDGTFGAKIADPATLPAGTGYSVSFSPDGKYIAVAHDTSPYISNYPAMRAEKDYLLEQST